MLNISGTPCTFALDLSNRTAAAVGGDDSVGLITQPGCYWTASSEVSWIGVTPVNSGTGLSTITFRVSPNGSTQPRQGTVKIGGQTLSVTQAGASTLLSVTVSHDGVFLARQVGATYSIVVTNSGPGGTAGTITAVERCRPD